MSQSLSYSTPSSRVKKYTDEDLSLFKMATICGYPGASDKCLPFLHSSFPGGPTQPLPKYFSFSHRKEKKSRSKAKRKAENTCTAVVCYKPKETIELPDIPTPRHTARSSPINENSYVNKNKVCFRLKGINPRQVYSVNRSKPNISTSHRTSLQCLRINPHRSNTLMDLEISDPWTLALESIAKATMQGARSDTQDTFIFHESGQDSLEREQSFASLAVKKQLEDERRFVLPGLRGKKLKDNRPLGQIVSQRRSMSMLSDDPRCLSHTYYKRDMTMGLTE